MTGTTSEQRASAAIEWLRGYAPSIDLFRIDERRCLSPHIVLDLGNAGLLGIQSSKEYGGLALTHADTLKVIEQLGAIDGTLAGFVGVHNFLGIRPIANYGMAALRDEALPLLASGRVLGAFAITEPGAGSNPRAMQATGMRQPDRAFALTGVKWWSGNAAWAGWINVFARCPGECGGDTVTGFALRRGTAGLRMGDESLTMGIRGMVQNAVHLEGARATEEQVLGRIGQGMEVAFDAMSYARLGIAASALGMIKRCAQLMLRYAADRLIGGGPLVDHPLTRERLSTAVSAAGAIEQLIALVTKELDAGRAVPPELFLICKTAAPELLWETVDACMQMHGGRGYSEQNPIARIFRDARLLRIFEGPTETLNHSLGVGFLSAPERGLSLLRSIGGHAAAVEIEVAMNEAEAELRRKSTVIRNAPDTAGAMLTAAVLATMARRGDPDSSWAQRRLTAATLGFRQRAESGASDLDTVQAAIEGFSNSIGAAVTAEYRQ